LGKDPGSIVSTLSHIPTHTLFMLATPAVAAAHKLVIRETERHDLGILV
jgi:hypothetical protein